MMSWQILEKNLSIFTQITELRFLWGEGNITIIKKYFATLKYNTGTAQVLDVR